MYSEFVFSKEMQLILAIITFSINTFNMYLISKLILMVYEVKASKTQRFIFAFLSGALLQTAFVYLVYFIGGAVSFSNVTYLLVVTPNPVFALLYYVIGIKVLKLSSIRSINLMGHFYVYYVFLINLNNLIVSIFFVQTTARYNYLQDALSQIAYFAIVYVFYMITKNILIKKRIMIRVSDTIFVNHKRQLYIYFTKTIFIYALSVLLSLFISKPIVSNLILLILLAMFFALNIFMEVYASQKNELENRKVHINTLSNGIIEFRGVKHDFYNILQTYGGYIEIGDLERLQKYHMSLLNITTSAGNVIDLAHRLNENPTLISLLMNKVEYSEKMNVQLKIKLESDLESLFIDDMDICRMLACLLDNAIESAAESVQKKVLFTIDTKPEGSKLIIITNSTATPIDTAVISAAGITSKQGHQGLGLATVRKTIEKYGNCSFQMTYYNYELSTYIELRAE